MLARGKTVGPGEAYELPIWTAAPALSPRMVSCCADGLTPLVSRPNARTRPKARDTVLPTQWMRASVHTPTRSSTLQNVWVPRRPTKTWPPCLAIMFGVLLQLGRRATLACSCATLQLLLPHGLVVRLEGVFCYPPFMLQGTLRSKLNGRGHCLSLVPHRPTWLLAFAQAASP